jgi:hypothetical protein
MPLSHSLSLWILLSLSLCASLFLLTTITGVLRIAPKYSLVLGVADYLRTHQTIPSLVNFLTAKDDDIDTTSAPLAAPLHSLAIALTSSFAGAAFTNPLDVVLME